jgi:hypothetical protein
MEVVLIVVEMTFSVTEQCGTMSMQDQTKIASIWAGAAYDDV